MKLQDGTIEMDVQVTRRRSFVYITFRMQDDKEYEDFYMRPHKSGLPDALQYAPVHQGQSAWQLYHGPGATTAVEFQPGAWTRLRLVVQGSRAAVFLGAGDRPAMVARLAREPRAGYIALRAFLLPDTPGRARSRRERLRAAERRAVRLHDDRRGGPGHPAGRGPPVGGVRGDPAVRHTARGAASAEALGRMQVVDAWPTGLVELHFVR